MWIVSLSMHFFCLYVLYSFYFCFFFFFFQAEDGIRDYKVTGVQTCALPISGAQRGHGRRAAAGRRPAGALAHRPAGAARGRAHGLAGRQLPAVAHAPPPRPARRGDRKSTRLNSSHLVISYAVFCLKKKNLTTL